MSENIQNPYQKQDYILLTHTKIKNLQRNISILQEANVKLKIEMVTNASAIIESKAEIEKLQLYLNDVQE